VQITSESPFSRFASAFAIAALTTIAACGGPEQAPAGTAPGACTLALAASTDDAHLHTAIENALRRQDPCNLPDPPLRAAEARRAGADVRTSYALIRVERDEESVRAVFQVVPEIRPGKSGE
jgi:hypothetical protein